MMLLDAEVLSTGGEDVRQYLADLRHYPMLSQQQELEVAKACAMGDPDAIRTMVSGNLRLVVSVAREYAGRGVPLLDLIQEGSIGLIIAARKFDHTLENRFSTYATKWVRQRILLCLNDQSGMIRIPAHTAQRMKKLSTAQSELRTELGREPSAAELAEKTDFSEIKVLELKALTPEITSLDIPVGEKGEDTLGTILPGDGGDEPQAEMIRRELKALLDRLMEELNDRQRTILRLHFGLEDGVCRSLVEIAKELGISKERVRQIERQAMDKLQKIGAGLGLEDFLE